MVLLPSLHPTNKPNINRKPKQVKSIGKNFTHTQHTHRAVESRVHLYPIMSAESSTSSGRLQPQGEQQQPVTAEPKHAAQQQGDHTCVPTSTSPLSLTHIQSVPQLVQACSSGVVDQDVTPHCPVLEDPHSGRCSPFDDGSAGQSHETLFIHILCESWILTPPPCFTASGSIRQLEESPLENLLIEHPSMSVYNIQGTWLEPREEVTEAASAVTEIGNSPHSAQQLMQQHATARPLFRQTACIRDLIKSEHISQRQQKAAIGKVLQRKCTERSNKAFHFRGCIKQGSCLNRRLRSSGFKNGCHRQRNH